MANIVILDDDPDILKAISRRLKDNGHEPKVFSNPEQGLHAIESSPPDLIILDRTMPRMSGDRIQERLAQDTRFVEIPVIFLSGKDLAEEKIQGLKLGVDDYITKPFEMGELLVRIENILRRQRIYEEKAQRDKLTGCMNRAAFDIYFGKLFKSAARYERVFSIAVVDLNELKRINDLCGHKAGDEALIQVAEALKKSSREPDFVARYGGDEFVVLFPETTDEGANAFIERVNVEIEKLPVKEGPGGERLKIGVSVGIAVFESSVNSAEELFQLADKRMYKSKFQARVSEKSKKRILVVEDEMDIRKAVLFRLQQAGFETLTAEDGESALRIARAMMPDLILLDLMLPKRSGEEVCKTIREDDDPLFSKIPIIMLTAKTAEVDQIVGRIIGANCYMTKPFNMNEMIKNVMKYA